MERFPELSLFYGLSSHLDSEKPMDEIYAQEYKQILAEIIDKPDLPEFYSLTAGSLEVKTFLIDGGATSSYYYGPLKPEK